jgi:hypothetical protein
MHHSFFSLNEKLVSSNLLLRYNTFTLHWIKPQVSAVAPPVASDPAGLPLRRLAFSYLHGRAPALPDLPKEKTRGTSAVSARLSFCRGG